MNQDSQLKAGSGVVPADGQHGDVFSGPTIFEPSSRPRPEQVATVGVDPGSYLRRAILWRVFEPAEQVTLCPEEMLDQQPEADAVVIQHFSGPVPSWDQLLEWTGSRVLIIDLHVAALMAAKSDYLLRVELASGHTADPLQVMCHKQNRSVYPNAPATEIVKSPPVATGFTIGDRVHMYVPSSTIPAIRGLRNDSELARFSASYQASSWGRETISGGSTLISCPTPAGGLITIMDLNTVDRQPEPNGSETPAIQIFLSLLGQSTVSFGRFVVPPARYSDFLDSLETMVARHPRFAMIERIGHSVDGREIRLVKIATRPNLPVVLLTCAIHPYEWASTYGILRYLRFLLDRLEVQAFEARELLETHQLWWVPSACPDGFDNRCQQPTGINLNRNFPGGWEYAAAGQLHWGSFGRPNIVNTIDPISLRGPAPASQPETRALIGLLERNDGQVVTLADFHENVGTGNFLHQYEDVNGRIAEAPYHVELLEGICQAFAGRFFEQRDQSFYQVDHRNSFAPGRICAWLGYAASRGIKGCVVEASGGDCTHYRTVRRIEYAAQVAEQVLAAELGRIYRNPTGEDREITLNLRRRPTSITCRIYNDQGKLIDTSHEHSPRAVTRTIPAAGTLRLHYND